MRFSAILQIVYRAIRYPNIFAEVVGISNLLRVVVLVSLVDVITEITLLNFGALLGLFVLPALCHASGRRVYSN